MLESLSSVLVESAQQLDLTFVPGLIDKDDGSAERQLVGWNATLVGFIDGTHVELTVNTERRHAVFLYGCSFPDLGLGLTIHRRSLLRLLSWPRSRVRIRLEAPVSQVAVIRATDADGTRRILGPAAQAGIVSLADLLPSFVVTDSTIDAIDRRPRLRLPTSEQIVTSIKVCVRVATELQREA